MFFIIKLLKKFFKIFNSNAAPWQIGLGVILGTMVGFFPLFPNGYGPAPLGWILILVALLINCHLGSFFMYMAIGKLLSYVCVVPALALGNACDGIAQAASGIPFLHASMFSHTGWLGMILIGTILAPIFAAGMITLTWAFRVKFRDRLLAKKKLVTAGKIGGNMILVRTVCWFFDL